MKYSYRAVEKKNSSEKSALRFKPSNFSTDHYKVVTLWQFFFVCASVASYVAVYGYCEEIVASRRGRVILESPHDHNNRGYSVANWQIQWPLFIHSLI